MLGKIVRDILRPAPRQPAAALESRQQPQQPMPVYFVGVGNGLFNTFFPRIWPMLGSLAAGAVSDRMAGNEIKGMGDFVVPVITLQQFGEAAGKQPVQLVHFCEDVDQYWGLEAFRQFPNVTVKDFLAIMFDLGVAHTYNTLREEQAWWEAHQDLTDQLAGYFNDDRSRATLMARLNAIIGADRHALVKASFNNEFEYFNRTQPDASFIPGDHEIYVDIGAAHGDTVDKFVKLTGGRFEKIYAFEPTPAQFTQLNELVHNDPRITALRAAVGDSPGKLTFYDNLDNPFGGNALSGVGQAIEVDCVQLDDVVDRCTLIKMDVEGYECRVLRGAKRLISEHRPDLAVTCYHYPQDMSEILQLVNEIHPYRNIALRHYSTSLYDSILLFSDRQSFKA